MSLEQVIEFHKKFKFPANKDLAREGLGQTFKIKGGKSTASQLLGELASVCLKNAASILPVAVQQREEGDERLARAQLILEETGEIIQALAERDLIALADGIADLKYVANGTSATYGIPQDKVDDAIHEENMSKTRSKDDSRMKEKNPEKGYKAADLETILYGKKGK